MAPVITLPDGLTPAEMPVSVPVLASFIAFGSLVVEASTLIVNVAVLVTPAESCIVYLKVSVPAVSACAVRGLRCTRTSRLH